MDAILGFLTQPPVQYLLALVGGFLLKKWAGLSKTIPLILQACNLVITLLATMFGVTVAHAATGDASTAPWWASFLQSIVMTLLANGTQSAAKNTLQLIGGPAAGKLL